MDEKEEIRLLKQRLQNHETAISDLYTLINEINAKIGLPAKQQPKAPR